MIIRYSVLNDFVTCPKAFYDRHILGKIQIEKSSALEFGTAIHLGVRTILNGEDGIQAFNMYWSSLKDVHMKYYQYSWKDLQELALNSFLPNFKSRHAKKFTDFEQEVQMEMPFLNGHTLQGTCDLVGNYEDKLTIADWKTSSKPYKTNKIVINPQLYIYSKLYQSRAGKLPEQVMYKVFNEKTGSINTIIRKLTIDDLNGMFNIIENQARNMLRVIESKELYHGPDCYCERL